MAKASKPAAPAQPVEDKNDGVNETTVGKTMTIKSNNAFTVVDNTEAEQTPPPKDGKAKPRKDELNGFKVVDYL